jgi:hypothetical protein
MALPLPCHGLRTVANKVDKRSHKPRESFWTLNYKKLKESEKTFGNSQAVQVFQQGTSGPEKAKKSKRDKGPV